MLAMLVFAPTYGGGIAKNGGRVSPPKNNFAKNASKRSRINALADLLILSEAMTGG